MKHLAFILAASLALSGCAGLGNIDSPDVKSTAIKTASTTLALYADVYQPAVIVYKRLPSCGQPASPPICRDDAIFHNLQKVDLAATRGITAAQPVLAGKLPDTGQVLAAIDAVTQAEDAISASGALAISAK
jgi:hypothetical protein